MGTHVRKSTLICVLAIVCITACSTPAEGPVETLQQSIASGNTKEAAELALQWSAELDRSAPDSAELAEWCARVMAIEGVGTKEQRLELAEWAVAQKTEQFGEEAEPLAHAHYVVGLIHHLAGASDEALPWFERALNIREQHSANNSIDLEIYLRELGSAQWAKGKLKDAKASFTRLLEITRQAYGKDDPGTTTALINLAMTEHSLGDLAASAQYADQAIHVLKQNDLQHDFKMLTAANVHAAALALSGKLAASAEAYELAISAAETDAKLNAQATTLRHNLGSTLLKIGDYKRARELFEQVLAEPTLDPSLKLKAQLNLVRLHMQSGDLRAADAMLTEAEETAAKHFNSDAPLLTALNRLVGEVRRSKEHYQLALNAEAEIMGERSWDYANSLSSLANFHLEDQKFETAETQLTYALDVMHEQVGETHPRVHDAMTSLAKAKFALGRPEAFQLAVKTEGASLAYDRNIITVLPERQALARVARPRIGRDLAIDWALSNKANSNDRIAAYDAIIRSRAVVFDQVAERRIVPEEHQELARELKAAREQLAGLFVMGPVMGAEAYRKQLIQAEREVERLDAALARASASHRQRRTTLDRGYDDVVASLPEETALVSYIRIHPSDAAKYVAISLKHGQSPRFVALGSAKAIDAAVSNWRQSLEPLQVAGNNYQNHLKVADELRRLIWDPIATHVSSAKQILIVPDGTLHLVSLAALPSSQPGRFLIEEGLSFHYLTAERELGAPSASQDSQSKGALIVGGPAFDQDVQAVSNDECASLNSIHFGLLPGATKEAKSVAKLWKNKTGSLELLDGTEATEDAVRQKVKGKRLLHFATHGFVIDTDCETQSNDSELMASVRGIGGMSSASESASSVAMDGSYANQRFIQPEDPLLLSGLAFRGANRRTGGVESDGIMTAAEVSALDLHGAELAVLSACRTGSGRIADGEGLFGLRRAFLLAGVQTVITNLWDVDDRSAESWMTRFYRNHWDEGNSVSGAVREASLKLLQERRAQGLDPHPFYWGGWMAAGHAGTNSPRGK